MTPNLKTSWRRALAAIVAGAWTLAAAAAYPDKPIHIVVPYAPGGGSDTLARQLAERLQPRLGQPVVIENRVGANGIIGTAQVAKAVPDGTTFVWVVNSHYINPLVTPKMPYESVADFAGVTLVAVAPGVLVVKSDPAISSVRDLVAKLKDGKGSYGSTDSSSQLAGRIFVTSQGLDAVHVPYKGGSEVVTAIVGGNVTMGFTSPTSARSLMQLGRLKALAVTGTKRSPVLPDVPTFAELGIAGLEQASTTFMLLAPKGTPAAVLAKFQGEVAAVLHEPGMQESLRLVGATAVGNTPAEFGQQMVRDNAFWVRAGQEAGLKPE